jgi:hypothetical protein
MINKKIISVALNLTVIFSTLFLFSACNKSSNPAGPGTSNEPVVTTFNKATRGWHQITGTNGITSTGDATSVTNAGGWMEAYANINVGIFEHPVVKDYVENDFTGDPGNYRVETNIMWSGSLAGNGIAGAGAHVVISMEVRDFDDNIITTQEVHDKEVKDSNLQIGGLTDDGSKDVVVDFNLPAGKTGFKVRFITQVEAWSGFLGALTQCHFWDKQYTGHGVGWSYLKITKLNN